MLGNLICLLAKSLEENCKWNDTRQNSPKGLTHNYVMFINKDSQESATNRCLFICVSHYDDAYLQRIPLHAPKPYCYSLSNQYILFHFVITTYIKYHLKIWTYIDLRNQNQNQNLTCCIRRHPYLRNKQGELKICNRDYSFPSETMLFR